MQLRPRTRVYTDSYGTSELLLCIYGKVISRPPTPVLIWLPRSYPIERPIIYVDLETLAGAPHALEQYTSNDGEIRLPLLDDWDAEKNNVCQVVEGLVDLERAARVGGVGTDEIRKISVSPSPRPPSEAAVPPRPPRPPKSFDSTAGSARELSPLPPKIPLREDPPVSRLAYSGPPQIPERPPITYSADLLDSEVSHHQDSRHKEALENLQRTLNELSLKDSQHTEHTIIARKVAIESAVKQFEMNLEYEKASLQRTLSAIENTKAVLNRETEDITQQSEQVHIYEEMHGKNPDPSALVATENAAVGQLYELVARDYALSDTVHTLGRLLNGGTIKLDTFVKKTRGLAREQFLTRMHMQKVITVLGQE